MSLPINDLSYSELFYNIVILKLITVTMKPIIWSVNFVRGWGKAMLLLLLMRIHSWCSWCTSGTPHRICRDVVMLSTGNGRLGYRYVAIRPHGRFHGPVTRGAWGRGVARGIVVPLDSVAVEVPYFFGRWAGVYIVIKITVITLKFEEENSWKDWI